MPTDAGTTLIPIARAAISATLGWPHQAPQATLPWLHEAGASFVTLTQHGQLRGCIGTLQAHRSVLEDVQANAIAAATRDPRFVPLGVAELHYTKIEVSLLSQMQSLGFADESEALAQLRPGIDGVVLEFGRHRSTFLPQVWEQLPGRREFMAHLKQKAGLPANFWADGVRLQRYTVAKWKESELPQATRPETA